MCILRDAVLPYFKQATATSIVCLKVLHISDKDRRSIFNSLHFFFPQRNLWYKNKFLRELDLVSQGQLEGLWLNPVLNITMVVN